MYTFQGMYIHTVLTELTSLLSKVKMAKFKHMFVYLCDLKVHSFLKKKHALKTSVKQLLIIN